MSALGDAVGEVGGEGRAIGGMPVVDDVADSFPGCGADGLRCVAPGERIEVWGEALEALECGDLVFDPKGNALFPGWAFGGGAAEGGADGALQFAYEAYFKTGVHFVCEPGGFAGASVGDEVGVGSGECS